MGLGPGLAQGLHEPSIHSMLVVLERLYIDDPVALLVELENVDAQPGERLAVLFIPVSDETGGVPLTMNASLTLFRSVVKGNTLEERQIMGPVESSNSVEVVVR